jgi:PEGA domain
VTLKNRLLIFSVLIAVLAAGLASSTEAQVRQGVARPVVVVRGGYYYDPFWYGYPGFGFGFGYPWYGFGYPWFPYQYPYGYGYPYAIDHRSSVRLEVSPREAEVYVDGYYAGIVDDYDGVFQRLHLPPGQHEIALYREGYRTAHQNVYLTSDSTFKVKLTMERLAAGDVAEPRPTPTNPPPAEQAQPSQPLPPPGHRSPDGRRVPPPNQKGPRGADGVASATLSIRVQPEDATVLIDGERWEGPQGQQRLVVQVSEGPHRIQIEKDGYEPFTTTVNVRPGETVPVNVSLRAR